MKRIKKTVEKRMFTKQDAASYLSISPYSITKMIHSGVLEFVKMGRIYLIDKIEIDNWIEKNKERFLF